MAGSIEGPRRVLDPMRVNLCLPRVLWSHFCCIECKNIAKNYFHLGQAITSGKYEGTLPLKGRARVLSWSELINPFFRPRNNGQTWIYSLVWGQSKKTKIVKNFFKAPVKLGLLPSMLKFRDLTWKYFLPQILEKRIFLGLNIHRVLFWLYSLRL